MEPEELLENEAGLDADPIATLEQELQGADENAAAREKIDFLHRCAQLLAQAPLGSVDVYAKIVREKTGATKETLVACVLQARRASVKQSGGSREQCFSPSEEDICRAQELLHDSEIANRYQADVEQLGVVGEKDSILVLLLTVVSRLLERPINVVLKSASSAGKSYLLNTVLSTLPPGEYIVLTAASEKALYFRTDSLAHKVLVFMERPGAESSDYQTRILQSEGKLIYSVAQKDPDTGEIVTVDREIEGPVAYIETTTQAALHDENETRHFSLTLDESREATTAIVRDCGKRESRRSAVDSEEVRRRWRTVQYLLAPNDVLVPYAERLAVRFPCGVIRARRDFPRFLALIKASALLHQYLRQRDDGGAIVADLDDYELARRLAKPLLEAALAGATTKTRDLIAESQELTREENPTSPESVTITSAKLYKRLSASGWSKTTVRRHLRAAEQAGYLDLVFQQRGREYEYRVVDGEVDTAIGLPTATELDPSAVEQAIRPDQTPDGAVKSSDVNDLAEVNQPDQGVGGEGFLFDPVPGPHSHDPDLE